MRRALTTSLAALAGLAGLTACGSSASSSSSSAASSASVASTTQTSTSAPAATGSAKPVAAVITTKHAGKLGTILAFGKAKLTVYLFEADKGPRSTCNGPCAAAWPPVIGTPKAVGGAMAADLGTIKRADGKMQVTYKGHPLYRFVKDKDDGDAYGQGMNQFGADWYVLAPSGHKVDES